eukprot:TRINITY_DN13965_c0_g1_i1.p1 TRINITY_DN13965_c0_g1~~TRINITY_DN13965_c0_g1_i1.p1  ORF type:complete len:1301 (+),score=244.64 TRINITY_DN13965_c0_g1_i1:79-3981(+)
MAAGEEGGAGAPRRRAVPQCPPIPPPDMGRSPDSAHPLDPHELPPPGGCGQEAAGQGPPQRRLSGRRRGPPSTPIPPIAIPQRPGTPPPADGWPGSGLLEGEQVPGRIDHSESPLSAGPALNMLGGSPVDHSGGNSPTRAWEDHLCSPGVASAVSASILVNGVRLLVVSFRPAPGASHPEVPQLIEMARKAIPAVVNYLYLRRTTVRAVLYFGRYDARGDTVGVPLREDGHVVEERGAAEQALRKAVLEVVEQRLWPPLRCDAPTGPTGAAQLPLSADPQGWQALVYGRSVGPGGARGYVKLVLQNVDKIVFDSTDPWQKRLLFVRQRDSLMTRSGVTSYEEYIAQLGQSCQQARRPLPPLRQPEFQSRDSRGGYYFWERLGAEESSVLDYKSYFLCSAEDLLDALFPHFLCGFVNSPAGRGRLLIGVHEFPLGQHHQGTEARVVGMSLGDSEMRRLRKGIAQACRDCIPPMPPEWVKLIRRPVTSPEPCTLRSGERAALLLWGTGAERNRDSAAKGIRDQANMALRILRTHGVSLVALPPSVADGLRPPADPCLVAAQQEGLPLCLARGTVGRKSVIEWARFGRSGEWVDVTHAVRRLVNTREGGLYIPSAGEGMGEPFSSPACDTADGGSLPWEPSLGSEPRVLVIAYRGSPQQGGIRGKRERPARVAFAVVKTGDGRAPAAAGAPALTTLAMGTGPIPSPPTVPPPGMGSVSITPIGWDQLGRFPSATTRESTSTGPWAWSCPSEQPEKVCAAVWETGAIGIWEVEGSDGNWHAYSPKLCAWLDEQVRCGSARAGAGVIEGQCEIHGKYQFNLVDMWQRRISTRKLGTLRRIRRLVLPQPAPAAAQSAEDPSAEPWQRALAQRWNAKARWAVVPLPESTALPQLSVLDVEVNCLGRDPPEEPPPPRPTYFAGWPEIPLWDPQVEAVRPMPKDLRLLSANSRPRPPPRTSGHGPRLAGRRSAAAVVPLLLSYLAPQRSPGCMLGGVELMRMRLVCRKWRDVAEHLIGFGEQGLAWLEDHPVLAPRRLALGRGAVAAARRLSLLPDAAGTLPWHVAAVAARGGEPPAPYPFRFSSAAELLPRELERDGPLVVPLLWRQSSCDSAGELAACADAQTARVLVRDEGRWAGLSGAVIAAVRLDPGDGGGVVGALELRGDDEGGAWPLVGLYELLRWMLDDPRLEVRWLRQGRCFAIEPPASRLQLCPEHCVGLEDPADGEGEDDAGGGTPASEQTPPAVGPCDWCEAEERWARNAAALEARSRAQHGPASASDTGGHGDASVRHQRVAAQPRQYSTRDAARI